MLDVMRVHFPAIFFAGFVALSLGWHLWTAVIRPALIPREEIERLAQEMIARHGGSAEEMAYIEEDSAWRRSDVFEQGKWRRVRKAIARRSIDLLP